ncbi:unnamed protein product [Acanthoscelides obtectus]|uniref:Helicase POLQ-like n=3 Tax=Acanthoscelides obtectus TaxID=200917 RepID=A0A9P0NUM5_ACAOB|nr:unnamed protein product [Acanthoscelides obtectus]CAK1678563.1 Helicase POLQ-like [Acanthoscelides obtectus]
MDNIDLLNSNDSIFNAVDFQELNAKGDCYKRKRNQLSTNNTDNVKDVVTCQGEGTPQGKKVKVVKSNPNLAVTNPKNDGPEDMFENTLDDINITMIENKEFDAFADFLKTPSTTYEAKSVPVKKDESCGDKDNTILSQFFNTQMIQQVDSAIDLGSSESFDQKDIDKNIPCSTNKHLPVKLHDETTSRSEKSILVKTQPTQTKTQNIDPLFLSFKERLKTRDWDTKILQNSVLFEDEKATVTYRKEVDNLFEQIEHSIFAMGDENTESETEVPHELLEVIFNSELNENENIEKSILNCSNLNSSFGSLIKKALISNANKAGTSNKTNSSILNATLVSKSFQYLGSFYGLPTKVKELIKVYKGIDELYDWQDECLKLPAIENRKNLIYALPTSGGKTLVAEILMFREIMCYKRNTILILPYVSIVQEKVWALSPFGIALDFLVEEYASSKGNYPPRKRRRKNSVYVATIEKALGIINSLIENQRLHEIGLIVVDEMHLIGEEGRGATLEACLTKIMFLKADIQIIGMSATIGNLPDICKFLDADVYTKDFRPVELVEYVKCGKEISRINWNYSEDANLLVEVRKIDYKYSESLQKIDPDMLGGLVMDIIPKGSCLVFCASKKNCENVTNLLCRLCKPELKNHKKEEKEQLIHALKDEGGELCDILKISVQYGIAYHHSGLTSDERRIIEEGFKSGVIYVICCTSTLAAGVNLPARRVILRSPYIGKDFINLSRYKQMVGRAGRAGLGEIGDSILISQPQDLPKVRELLMSPMNQAVSGMHMFEGKGLRHLLLSCISLGIANTRPQLQEVAKYTLLAVQNDRLEVNIKKLVDSVIKNLFKLGALKESCGKIKEKVDPLGNVSVKMDTSTMNDSVQESTPSKMKKVVVLSNSSKLVVSELGCAAIKGGLELSRAHLLYEDLSDAQSCLVLQGHLHLLYLVTPYETADQIKPNMQVYYEVLTRLKPNERKVAKTLGMTESVTVKMLSNNPIKNVPERVINRFYVTLMLYDLWNEMPVFQVSEKYQISRGIVQNLMTISATFATNVVNFCEELEEFWPYAYLLRGMGQRLSHCCVRELLPLMDLPAVKQGICCGYQEIVNHKHFTG